MRNIKPIVDGECDGDVVWICDLRFLTPLEKAIRRVPPTQVMIMSNSTTSTRVNYSHSHFRPFGKNGKVTSKVIKPFDNTGYRSLTGTPLMVFDTEQECVDHWNKRCNDVASDIQRAKLGMIAELDAKMQEILISAIDNP